jgi:hypothetical protein
MNPTDRTDFIRNTLSVAPAAPDGLYVLTTVYPESDALNSSGQLLHHRLDEEALTRCVLNTASPLAAMWVSPLGSLWLAGADGTVWTTADIGWGPVPGLQFEVLDEAMDWKATRLPVSLEPGLRSEPDRHLGNIRQGRICATASGAIYHWDGAEWRESQSGFEVSLTKLHGTGPGDVYCVGYKGAVSHYDGENWRPVSVTGIAAFQTIVTGVCAVAPGLAHLVTNRGSLLTGNGEGFSLAASGPGKVHGDCELDGTADALLQPRWGLGSKWKRNSTDKGELLGNPTYSKLPIGSTSLKLSNPKAPPP